MKSRIVRTLAVAIFMLVIFCVPTVWANESNFATVIQLPRAELMLTSNHEYVYCENKYNKLQVVEDGYGYSYLVLNRNHDIACKDIEEMMLSASMQLVGQTDYVIIGMFPSEACKNIKTRIEDESDIVINSSGKFEYNSDTYQYRIFVINDEGQMHLVYSNEMVTSYDGIDEIGVTRVL